MKTSNYRRQLQIIINEYRRDGQAWPASVAEMAQWAIRTKKFALPEQTVEKICARELAQAMREEYITDSKGRRVRAKHPAKFKSGNEQKTLWDDIRTASHPFMEKAIQLRRNHIVGECRQAKTDVDSYNDAHPKERAIQLVLDFTRDIEELEILSKLDNENNFDDLFEGELEEDELEKIF